MQRVLLHFVIDIGITNASDEFSQFNNSDIYNQFVEYRFHRLLTQANYIKEKNKKKTYFQ